MSDKNTTRTKRIYSASHGKYAVYENGKFVRWEKRA